MSPILESGVGSRDSRMKDEGSRIRHLVYKAAWRPLTLMGVERRLFFLALLLGAATFNLFYSLLAGVLTFAIVYAFARMCATADAQMLQILLRSLAGRPRYDAARHDFGITRR
jgi:type IV secretory pathway TrbD component